MASSLFYEVSATDPVALAVVVALLLAAAFLVAVIPARMGARIEPAVALRLDD